MDKSNRDGEKFICTECGYHEHADIGAAKTIRDRAREIGTWGLSRYRAFAPKRSEDILTLT
ncbi:hypothetical protein [Microcoleus sp. B13-B4]|uniref:hypothetical protein n=1 Tax=Microcoleus sp. B13-B4 TaxID=2818651 RepID=UPI002FD577D0